jgi:[acyl-carrier-protein] S-malonyltransferase
VLSGHRAAVERAVELAKSSKPPARRTVWLPVSAPFHCALMQPAVGVVETELGRVRKKGGMRAPECAVVSNVTALPVSVSASCLPTTRA